MKQFETIEYLLELFERDEVRLSLPDGRVVVLRRAGLGRHYHLHKLSQLLRSSPLEHRVDLLCDWLNAAGVKCDLQDELKLADLPELIHVIAELNAPRGQMPWRLLPTSETEGRGPRPIDYAGRGLALIVDRLARHYGWSLEEIINLPPEVALAHVQECLLHDRRRREWERYLSELFWEYDEGTKSRHYRPPPPIPWERFSGRREYSSVPQELKDRYYPKGKIVDLTRRNSEKHDFPEE